jgi:hypothetical protein
VGGLRSAMIVELRSEDLQLGSIDAVNDGGEQGAVKNWNWDSGLLGSAYGGGKEASVMSEILGISPKTF